MHNPHLISCSTGGDVESLLENVIAFATHRQWRPVRRIDHRQKHDVALIALKVGGLATQSTPIRVLDFRKVPPKQEFDDFRLLATDKADDPHRHSRILRLLSCRD